MRYYAAFCDSIDIPNKQLKCTTSTETKDTFTIDFDHLVIAVGAYSNTFGIPGVKEHAFFLKEVMHARLIRQRIIECNLSP